MSIFTGVVVYLMVFWTVLFCILPWGNKAPKDPEIGHMTGAPAVPRVKQKFVITGIVSAVIWVLVYVLIKIEIIDFYDIARKMMEDA